MKKSLVTGGAGFIGSHIVDRLLQLGHEVVVIDNESSDGHDNYYWNSSAINHKLDVCDISSIQSCFSDVNYVFHLAAKVSVQESVEEPLPTFITNALGTANVLECSRLAGVERFVYSSTSACYGEENPVPSLETMREDPINSYAIGKLSGEQMVKSYNKLFGMKTVSFRYTNVYGDRSRSVGSYAPVISKFIDAKYSGKHLKIFGDGEQRRDFIHVDDVVSANVSITFSELNSWGETINIGYGKNWSINEIASIISDDVIYYPARAGEMRETLANIDKAMSYMTWKPKVNLIDWIHSKI